MNPFFLVLKSLLLSMLLLAGSAFAADKVDINRADAAQLEASLVGIGPTRMAYDKVIPVVQAAADVLGSALQGPRTDRDTAA